MADAEAFPLGDAIAEQIATSPMGRTIVRPMEAGATKRHDAVTTLLRLAYKRGVAQGKKQRTDDEERGMTIEKQIAAVQREIRMRRSVYGRRLADGAMTQAEHDEGIAVMVAVLQTLTEVRDATQPRML